jgi:hypothetical protein
METQMTIVMIVLSKMIIQYSRRFSEAKAVCDKNPNAFYLVQVFAGAASVVP